jgi:hypothetical protein
MFLNSVQSKFCQKFGERAQTALPFSLNTEFRYQCLYLRFWTLFRANFARSLVSGHRQRSPSVQSQYRIQVTGCIFWFLDSVQSKLCQKFNERAQTALPQCINTEFRYQGLYFVSNSFYSRKNGCTFRIYLFGFENRLLLLCTGSLSIGSCNTGTVPGTYAVIR